MGHRGSSLGHSGSFVVERKPSSRGMQASVVAACRLCCSKSRGILAPQLGIKPMSPALQGKLFNHWTTKEVPAPGCLMHVCRTEVEPLLGEENQAVLCLQFSSEQRRPETCPHLAPGCVLFLNGTQVSVNFRKNVTSC